MVATLLAPAGAADDGIVLFNDAGLVNYLPGESSGNRVNAAPDLGSFAFTSDPSTLYAQPFEFLEDPSFFTTLTLDNAGLHYKQPPSGSNGATGQGSGAFIVSDGNLLYTNAAQVWDPKTRQLLHTYAAASPGQFDSVVPDTAHGKTFFLESRGQYNDRGSLNLRSYDQTSLEQSGTLSFAQDQNFSALNATELVRWGASGFAFRYIDAASNHANDAVLLLTSSIVGGSNVNPAPVAASIAPASVVAGGPDFTLTVTGSSFISGSTVLWNGSPRITSFVSATQLTASIYASDIAAPGGAAVGVVNPGPGGGDSNGLTVTIAADVPPAPAPQLTITPATLNIGYLPTYGPPAV
ncbi:MAG: hypothetical protein ACR2JE_16415 [Acidobacteriaceae bacterium]